MEIESVLNKIQRNLHCICGRKRNTAEAVAAYMSDYYHQGELCLCQLFSESSMLNNVLSSHHTTSQLNPRTHSAGIGTTVTWTPLLENSHALISANVGSRKRTADAVNSSTQTMIPESEGEQEEDEDEHNLTAVYEELSGYIAGMRVTAFCLSIKLHKYESAKSTCLERKENCCICLESEGEPEDNEDVEQNLTVENEEIEGEPQEDEDAKQNLTVGNEESEGEREEDEDDEQNRHAVENEDLLELLGYVRNDQAGLRVRGFYLSIKLHKYEYAKSTCLEGKDHCCICLDDYYEGEQLGKIDCGHVYHVDCIKEWIIRQNTCPICKREALARLPW